MTERYKIVLLGEGRVGKTSILVRYIKGEYNERQVSTLQASYLDKKFTVDNHSVQLSIWDTAGQERFHALGPIYYRDAHGAFLVYDITDDSSFQKVQTWVRELRRMVGESITLAIVGNKTDLQRNRKVSQEAAEKYAKSVGALHFLTSAKLNKGLDDAFVALTKQMIVQSSGSKKSSKSKHKNNALLATDDDSTSPHSNRTGARGQRIQIVDDSVSGALSPNRMASHSGKGKHSSCC